VAKTKASAAALLKVDSAVQRSVGRGKDKDEYEGEILDPTELAQLRVATGGGGGRGNIDNDEDKYGNDEFDFLNDSSIAKNNNNKKAVTTTTAIGSSSSSSGAGRSHK
jgi:hypothetical protein